MKRVRKCVSFLVIALILLGTETCLLGQALVSVPPAKDNTIYSDEEEVLSNGAGSHLFAGVIARSPNIRRALLQFDLEEAIPDGAIVDSVKLTLGLSRSISTERPVSLHRLLKNWGEGSSDAPGEEGRGTPAIPGDATWFHVAYDSTFWDEPGGDFVSSPSAVSEVGITAPPNVKSVTWGPTGGMLMDVRLWLAKPDSNFGWIIRGDETTMATAKRFDSRENSESPVPPTLTIYYSTDTGPIIEAFPNLPDFVGPTDLEHADDGTDRLFVGTLEGRIYAFENRTFSSERSLFMDLTDQVSDLSSEEGLQSFTFHPDFPDSAYVFVHYSGEAPRCAVEEERCSIISRFTVDDATGTTDPETELQILEVAQPFFNHNGGEIAFGLDGYLYIGFGDGGSQLDPLGNGQNPANLLSTLLRIDVDQREDGRNYRVPSDNPFVDSLDHRDEIWAYGLRNPWRFSFDPVDGTLWLGDVGQNSWEEIDIVQPGHNYGWSIMEGTHCHPRQVNNCDTTGLTLPIWDYSHKDFFQRSVTGGFVYRGVELPEYEGKYIYADFIEGEIWALTYSQGEAVENELISDTELSIVSFGTDSDNELYIVDFNGRLYRIRPSSRLKAIPAKPADGAIDMPPVFSFTWIPGAEGLLSDIEVAADPQFNDVIESNSGLEDNSWRPGPFDYGRSIYWRVRFTEDGVAGPWSDPQAVTIESLPAPTLLAPGDSATTSPTPTFVWRALAPPAGLDLELSSDALFDDILQEQSIDGDTSWTADELSFGTDLYWRARHQNDYGTGPWSEPRILTVTALPAPALVFPEDGATDQLAYTEFVWNAPVEEGATAEIEVALDSMFTNIVHSTEDLADTTWTSGLLEYSTTYYWRVRFRNDNGPGAWSEVRELTIAVGTASEGDLEIPITLETYPNPAASMLAIEYSVQKPAEVELEVFDVLGRRMLRQEEGLLHPGIHRLILNLNGRPPGLYWFRVGGHNGRFTVIR